MTMQTTPASDMAHSNRKPNQAAHGLSYSGHFDPTRELKYA